MSQGAPKGGSSRSSMMPLVLVLYVVALGACVTLALTERRDQAILGLLLVLTISPVAFVGASLAGDRGGRHLAERVEEMTQALKELREQAVLSDDARRVLNRAHERELLRRVIQEDIQRGDWDAALVLVKELADRFGYRVDAEEFRKQIHRARSATLDRQVTEAVATLDGLILQKRWDEAFADAARIQRLYPDSPRVEPLRARVESARQNYKAELERRFLVAANESRTDEALVVLKELDAYLSPDEAEPLREMTRGIIGKHRENLGAQFRLAVKDRRWREAVRYGEGIIAEFPNSRMAAEVRDLIDGIRSRANGNAPTA